MKTRGSQWGKYQRFMPGQVVYIYFTHLLWVLQFELGETLKGLPLQERLENIEVHVFSLFFCLPCVLLVLLDVARGRHCSKCWRSFLKWAPAESTESQHDGEAPLYQGCREAP